MPLIAPGIFISLLLVYIPLFTDFASPALVGGTSGYMLGNVVNDYVLESGDLNRGAAMSIIMLVLSALFALDRLPARPDQQAGELMADGERYDAVIVGGGHNGLVAGFYLARAGLQAADPRAARVRRRRLRDRGVRARLPRLDRRLRDQHAARARLARHEAGRARHHDRHRRALPLRLPGRRAAAARRRHPGRAGRDRPLLAPPTPAALPDFEDDLGRLADGRRAADGHDASRTPATSPPASCPSLLKLAGTARKHRAAINDALFLFATSATQYLGEFFESDVVKAALGWHAINDSIAGPSTPGTAYVLLHDHAAEQAGGGLRTWGFVRGGIGRVTEAMADAAREAGAEIRTSAEVERVVVAGGRATGVELVDGTVIEAERVLSNADPLRTFFGLVGEELPARPTSTPRSATTAARARA